MAFTVEDGTIVASANSYLSVEAADTYHTDRGNTTWTDATTAAKQAALIKATDYLVQTYRTRWKGIRVDTDQTLDWPRAGVLIEDYFEPQSGPRPALFPGLTFVLGDDVVPEEVKKSTAELALIALTTDLNPSLERGGDIRRLKAGSVEVEYGPGAQPFTVYRNVDGYLRPLLMVGNRLIRG